MLSKIKPVPRFILIALVVGGGIYGAMQFAGKDKAAPTTDQVPPMQSSQSAPAAPMQQAPAPAPAAAVAPPQHAAGAGSTLKGILDKGVVRASVQSPAEPFFVNDRGVAKGFNVDFMAILFGQSEFIEGGRRITVDTDASVDTYAAVPEQLLKRDYRGNPSVDIAIDGLTFTDSDLPGVIYSIPYVDDFGYSLIGPSTMVLKSQADINSMTIGLLQGDPDAAAYVKSQFPSAKIVELSDATTNGKRDWINRAITSGQVDAVVYDYPFAVAEIKDTKLQFIVSKLPGSDIKYKIGVRQEDRDLLDRINVAIRKSKATPGYGDLIRKYFSSTNVSAARAAAGGEGTYTVKSGDTLSIIAASQLGNAMRYAEIEARNNLPNPNLIRVGQRLVIPK
jgi:ABC-type amino acid transport substrate-binding protein